MFGVPGSENIFLTFFAKFSIFRINICPFINAVTTKGIRSLTTNFMTRFATEYGCPDSGRGYNTKRHQ